MSENASQIALTDPVARPRTGLIVQALAVLLSLTPVLGVALWSILFAL